MISFDKLDILDDIHIPKGDWGRADYLEPITKDFKVFGLGGCDTGNNIFQNKIYNKYI